MTGQFESRACTACARAKRRCNKSLPLCDRCYAHGLTCKYPVTQSGRFEFLTDLSTGSTGDETMPSSNIFMSKATTDIAQVGCGVSQHHPPIDWFTFPESWSVAHLRISVDGSLNPSLRERAVFTIKNVHAWLAKWITTGNNPFIHARLYKSYMPECVQDAYSTLSGFLHRNLANDSILSKTLQTRVERLLADNKLPPTSNVDLVDHVARVHALLIYQVLGLYDSDAEQRAQAENRNPLLASWLNEMLSHCTRTSSLTDCLSRVSDSECSHAEPLAHLWYTWILSETVRRTWLVGFSVICWYECLNSGPSNACHDGVMFTTRKGVWEAPTAEAWEELGLKTHFGLMRINEAKTILRESDPEEIDVLARVLIEAMPG